MTEDEAKKKWCHRAAAPGKFERCVASECMAWRTRDVYRECEERHSDESPGPDWVPATGEPGLWLLAKYAPDGYCGLAGHP